MRHFVHTDIFMRDIMIEKMDTVCIYLVLLSCLYSGVGAAAGCMYEIEIRSSSSTILESVEIEQTIAELEMLPLFDNTSSRLLLETDLILTQKSCFFKLNFVSEGKPKHWFWEVQVSVCLAAGITDDLEFSVNPGIMNTSTCNKKSLHVNVMPAHPEYDDILYVWNVSVNKCYADGRIQVGEIEIKNEPYTCKIFQCNADSQNSNKYFWGEEDIEGNVKFLYTYVANTVTDFEYEIQFNCSGKGHPKYSVSIDVLVTFFGSCACKEPPLEPRTQPFQTAVQDSIRTRPTTSSYLCSSASFINNSAKDGFFDKSANIAAVSTAIGFVVGVIVGIGVSRLKNAVFSASDE